MAFQQIPRDSNDLQMILYFQPWNIVGMEELFITIITSTAVWHLTSLRYSLSTSFSNVAFRDRSVALKPVPGPILQNLELLRRILAFL
jgi:hypothetical protein